jgi:hypothetical protein
LHYRFSCSFSPSPPRRRSPFHKRPFAISITIFGFLTNSNINKKTGKKLKLTGQVWFCSKHSANGEFLCLVNGNKEAGPLVPSPSRHRPQSFFLPFFIIY